MNRQFRKENTKIAYKPKNICLISFLIMKI